LFYVTLAITELSMQTIRIMQAQFAIMNSVLKMHNLDTVSMHGNFESFTISNSHFSGSNTLAADQ